MPRIKAPRKSAQRIVIVSTFFLLLSIPLVLLGLSEDSLDIRNRAYEELEVGEENPCVISFPYVNPYSLEAGKTFTVEVEAESPRSTISTLQITDSSGNSIYTENFKDSEAKIYTNFKYTPEKSGQIDILGLVQTEIGESFACKISSPYDILGLKVVTNNSKPTFTTTPSESKPSQAIVTNAEYEYTLTATDEDSDNINYSYSFTPQADWLKPLVIEDGSDGDLTIKFSGSTNKAASYLANVIIHDGYSKHISTQSWVISVSPEENDLPQISILSPLDSLRIDKGDTFKTKWDATDLNQITKYQLYMASNPTDEDSWSVVNESIDYKTTEYTVQTSDLTPGTYKLIARAIDNQDPEGIGMDISDEIVISGTTEPITDSDDKAIIDQPQVTNMSPSSTEEVTNLRATLKATILAGENATLLDSGDNITFKLDDINKSADLKINKLSDNAYTLIYQPQEDLTSGLHKVEIHVKDSNGGEVTKSWTFNISAEEETDSGLISVFGYELSQRTLLIIGGGIILVILAIVAPIVIIRVWKDDKDEAKENTKIPPTTPEDKTQYQSLVTETDLKEKVETEPVIEEKTPDTWDKYNTLKPDKDIREDLTPEKVKAPMPDEGKQSTDLALLEGKQVEKQPQTLTTPEPIIEPKEEEKKPEPVIETKTEPTSPPTPEPVIEPTPQSTEPEEPEIKTPEPPKEDIQPTIEPKIPEPNIPQPVIETTKDTQTTTQPEIPEPSIPEPNIPSFENLAEQESSEEEILKQLYSQIQQVQEEDAQKTSSNS